MHSITSAVVFLGLAAIASAAGCNSSFSVAAGSDCITKCRQSAGKALSADYTIDPTSSNFVTSLSYECEKGSPAYTTYMTQSGMCMMNCSTEEQADFGSREHADICTWYEAHKTDQCDGSSGSASSSGSAPSSSPSSSSGAHQKTDAHGSGSGSDASPTTSSDSSEGKSEDKAGESAASNLKLGGLIVSVAAAGTAALLL